MKTSVSLAQCNAKTFTILFVCLCIIVIFAVSFEASLVVRLNKTWCVLQSDVASLNEKTRNVLKTAKETLLQHEDKNEHDDIPPLPPCIGSKLLVGKLNIKDDVTADKVKNASVLSRVQKGGTYKPKDCKPTGSVAIIIPYRDREKHLGIFVNYMHAFLQRQQLQYGIFVVEPARPTTFNRGLLANVGFLAAQRTGLYNCFVIHDVDLLPLDDRNIYNCSDQLHHLSVVNSKFKGLPYKTYVGGVVSLKEATYMNINGFSNLYFGWGGEDDDLEIRGRQNGYSIDRPDKSVAVYKALPHVRDKLNQINKNRFNLVTEAKNRWQKDGINSMNYQILTRKEDDLYTLVHVKVNQSDVLNTNVKLNISGVPILESDLLTIRNKGRINIKIINAYLHLLQVRSKGKIVTMKYQFKFLKNPELPKDCVSSGVQFIFIPVQILGHWCLTVINPKQESIACLDPIGLAASKHKTAELDFIRHIYQKQFGIDLKEIADDDQMKFPEDKYDSGLLIMMYANALLTGNTLKLQQVDIDGARAEIESTLRRK